MSRETLLAVWEKLTAVVQPGDTVVFAGKNPPGMADELLAAWIRRLKSLDVRVCVDTVGEPMRLALAQCPDISQATVQRTLIDLQQKEEIIKLGGGRYTAYTWNRERN